ncbi:MAG: DegV family protein [Coriobacteriia bacterium]|nr:DegV family protein [Coriobacteriia bacterium]
MAKIVVDSGCDLPDEFDLWYPDVTWASVPLTLTVDGLNYVDELGLDVLGYLEHSERSAEGPTTAAPPPQLYLDAYQETGSIFVVTLSSKLSASFESACLAARLRAEQVKGSLTHVFDSFSASVGEALIAMEIAEQLKKRLPDIELISNVEKFISNMSTYFILDNFDTAVKTGRMSKTVATMADFLNIKPLCAGVNGEMKVIKKARNYQKALQQMIDIAKSNVDDISDRILAISHCQAYEKALASQAMLMAALPFKDSFITTTSGLCSTYAARGGVIFAF